jgi:hypothetical protein
MKLATPVSYAVPSERSSPKFAAAFAQGCGGSAVVDDALRPGPVALFGSPARQALLAQARAEGRDWYYGDHGVFRRFAYYRVTRNAMQYTGPSSTDRARWDALRVETQPDWIRGGTIVICPNSRLYMSWFGIDAGQWVIDIVSRLATLTDRHIVVRWKSTASTRPLYHDLHAAHMVVVFSSACAVEALAAGVPVCTLAPWASTARMGITDLAQIENPYYPTIRERDEFLFGLANNQWTLDEIRSGVAWRWFREERDRCA